MYDSINSKIAFFSANMLSIKRKNIMEFITVDLEKITEKICIKFLERENLAGTFTP